MISVIMSTYNEAPSVLKKAIDSILNQTLQDFEFLVVLDNPNNQKHIKILEAYEKADSRIRFFKNEKNLGLTASLNKLLAIAKGDYIARMDADDISLPDRFERQFNHIQINDYDLIGGKMIMVDEDENIIQEIKSIPTDEKRIKKCLKYSQCIAHPTWFAKRNVFDQLDGYRDVPFCEDYDLTLRASLQGFRISNLNEPVLYYRMTSDSISRQNLYKQYLYMRCITSAYSNGEVADIDTMHENVNRKFNEKLSKSFVQSNVIFNRMLKEKTEHKYIPFMIDGFRLMFGSKEFLDKVFRFIRLAMNS